MSSYVKNTIVERTVLLTNLGVPVLGVLPAQVTLQYKKNGQTVFQTLVLNGTSWVEVGSGFYTVIFSVAETDTVGTFAYTATGASFDNLVFEQINIIDPTAQGDQQAYFQDVASERTVYLEKIGVPAATILYSAVVCKIKKAGQLGFSTKSVTVENWINLGNGFYTIKFSADDLSKVGTFVYTLASTGFDNFAYDEFTILAAPDTTIKDKCVVTGQFVDLSGQQASQIKVSAHAVDYPTKLGKKMVSGDIVYTFLDFEGKFQIPLLRGSTVIIEVPRAAIRHQIKIPDAPSAELISLLPPFAVDYSI